MLQALIRTITELLDSKKSAYSFIAALGACVLHLYFEISVQDALLLVSPLGLATVSQAHVDAAAAKRGPAGTTTATVTATVEAAAPADAGPSGSTDGAAAKIDG